MRLQHIIYLTLALSACAAPSPDDDTATSKEVPTTAALPFPVATETTSGSAGDGVVEKAAGGQNRTGVGPNLYVANRGFALTLPYQGPSFGAIIGVNYRWSVSYVPRGLVVLLCRANYDTCTNVSASQSGTTNFFNGYLDNVPFILVFGVLSDEGVVSPPMIGGVNQLLINHQ